MLQLRCYICPETFLLLEMLLTAETRGRTIGR